MIGLVEITQRAPASSAVDMRQAGRTRASGQRMLFGAVSEAKSLHHGSFGLPLTPVARPPATRCLASVRMRSYHFNSLI